MVEFHCMREKCPPETTQKEKKKNTEERLGKGKGQKGREGRGREGKGGEEGWGEEGSYPTHCKCALKSEYCLLLQNRKERTEKVGFPLLDAP